MDFFPTEHDSSDVRSMIYNALNPCSSPVQRLAPALESRLSSGQREALLYNRALLMEAAHRTEAARAAVAAFERQFPASPRTPLLRAALLLHDGKVGGFRQGMRPCMDNICIMSFGVPHTVGDKSSYQS